MAEADVRRATMQEQRAQIGEDEQIEEGWEWLDCCGFDYICDWCAGDGAENDMTEQKISSQG
jgi:hypothetical protein